jgi:hypothetical protein
VFAAVAAFQDKLGPLDQDFPSRRHLADHRLNRERVGIGDLHPLLEMKLSIPNIIIEATGGARILMHLYQRQSGALRVDRVRGQVDEI